MVPLLVRRLGVSLIVIATAACGSATGPSLRNLVAQRAMWSAQSLTNYSYHFEEAGFFICCTEGQDLTLQVRNDSVVSAVFTATGQPATTMSAPSSEADFRWTR